MNIHLNPHLWLFKGNLNIITFMNEDLLEVLGCIVVSNKLLLHAFKSRPLAQTL